MRPLPDAAEWVRLSALFDAGLDLPAELRPGWIATLSEDEPERVVAWLRDMLAQAEAARPGDDMARGPRLPAWRGEAAQAAAEAVATAVEDGPEVGDKADAGTPATAALDASAAPAASAASAAPAPPPPPADETAATAALTGRVEMAEVDAPAETAGDTEATADLDRSEPGPPPPSAPAPQAPPRLAAPPLATGLRLGPWRLLGPMTSSDARASHWRARRADDETPGPEVVLRVPHQWRPRPELEAWLAHAAARPVALVHAHIARLTAVGVTEEGTPWIASEIAEGQSIDRWCRDRSLGLPQRRVLVEQALEAATFAHGRLVLHGQVHPSQIVITPEGRLRWLNFGLAELLDLLDAPPVVETPATGPSVLAYAAPEQTAARPTAGATGPGVQPPTQSPDQPATEPPADGAPALPSAAADIYALGLIAFEVLSGASPWQPRTSGSAAVAAPGSRWPRPSDLVSATRLRRGLRGDLDAIVVKATLSDPGQRYASAAEFLDDIRRVGAHRPVTAVEGGFAYQVGRLARRHPRLATLATVLATTFTVFLVGLSWRAWVWSTEQAEAESERRTGEAVSRLLQDLLQENAWPAAGRSWPELLVHAESVARTSLKEQPVALASVLALLGRHHAEAGAFAEARNLLAEARPGLTDRTRKLEASCDEAWAQARQGDKAVEAELLLRRVTENRLAPPLARILCNVRVADLERRSGRERDAFNTTYTAWELWRDSPEKPSQLAMLLGRPGGVQSAATGRFHDAQGWLEWSLKHAALLQQDKGPVAIEMREQWADIALAAGDAARALTLADANLAAVSGEAFPAEAPPATAAPAVMYLLAAEPRLELHQLAEARLRLERALALATARGDAVVAQHARCLLAAAAMRERDAGAAERWLKTARPEEPARRSLLLADAPPGAAGRNFVAGAAPSSPDSGELRNPALDAEHACQAAAVELALLQGRHTEAQRGAERLQGLGKELAPRVRAGSALVRAEALLAAGQYERALSAALQALQQARALHQSDVDDQKARPSFRSGQAALVLAEAHRANGDIEEAKKSLDYALQQLSATLPEAHPWRKRAEATKAALAVHAAKKP